MNSIFSHLTWNLSSNIDNLVRECKNMLTSVSSLLGLQIRINRVDFVRRFSWSNLVFIFSWLVLCQDISDQSFQLITWNYRMFSHPQYYNKSEIIDLYALYSTRSHYMLMLLLLLSIQILTNRWNCCLKEMQLNDT